MQNMYKKQQGLTLISLVFILGIIGFFVLVGLRVAPIYMNHSKVVHALETLKNQPDIETKSKSQVYYALIKQFNMNYVENIKKSDIKIIARSNYLKIRIKYHVKKQFIANLSIWVDFDNSIEVGSP